MTCPAFFGGAPGPMELLLILLVILLLFGARRLPDLARALGKSLSEFKKGRDEGARMLDDADGKPPKETESAESDNAPREKDE